MAKNKSYTIYINLNSLPQGSGAMAEQESSTLGGPFGENATEADAMNAAKHIVSFATMAATADRIVSTAISEVSMRTGANEYEQRLDATYSAGKSIIGAGAALAIGAATGTLPVVALGMVMSSINKALSISQKATQLNMAHSLEDISINMQNIRAGTSGRRSNNQ